MSLLSLSTYDCILSHAAVIRAPKSSHINPAVKSLHWLKIIQRIVCIYNSFSHIQSPHRHSTFVYNLISVQPHRSTRSSYIITLSRPPSSSSLKVNNRSFRHASPCLWNQLPKQLRLPTDHKDLSLLSDLTHVSSSFPSSPLSPSITPSYFHSILKTHLSTNSFLFFYLSTHRTDSTDSSCFPFFSGMSVFTLALCELSSIAHLLHIIIVIIIIFQRDLVGLELEALVYLPRCVHGARRHIGQGRGLTP